MKNAIQKKVHVYCKAVENQDQNAFRELFDRDATLISISALYNGIDAIADDFLGAI